MFIAVFLAVAAVIITALFLGEAAKYRAGLLPISPRRFRLRFTAWLLALLLCGAILAGLFLIPRPYAESHPAVVLGLLSFCLLAAIALIWIMLADLQEVEDKIHQREAEVWRDFARLLTSEPEKDPRPGAPGSQEPPAA